MSTKHQRQLSGAIEPLILMLRCGEPEATEAAILALLNLAVKDERFDSSIPRIKSKVRADMIEKCFCDDLEADVVDLSGFVFQ
ncbi:hypothetical protein J5N97_025451 [Dioscorea zingiberensis]|uniref:Uncharacterized protein n=1 Tax=Dioscorea zingiberensis TaxID=325984 RepID=A0A9D5C9A0_9LILI|nr:hypothetical protein J5N97_025451 [Dioscorea zingiberensis]